MPDDDLENTGSETGLSEDVKMLSEGEDEAPKEEEVREETPEQEEEEAPSSEELDETEEGIEEEEEPVEDEIEDEEITSRPAWKTIKEKYPELAKDKDFKQVFFREKAYSEVFPTLQEAKDASEKVQVFDYLDSSLAAGSPKELLSALDEPVLVKFARNILPALHSTNREAFKLATQPLIFEILNEINDVGLKNNDQNLQISVKNISKFLTGKFEVPPRMKKADPELENERKNLEQERNRLVQDKKVEFFTRADKSIDRQLVKAIEDGLDPKNELTPFVRNAIIEKVLAEVKSTVGQDANFVNKIKHLERLAQKAGYTTDYMPRFISAYLGRAKQLAINLRAKHKAAAIARRASTSKTRVEGSGKEKTTQTSTKGGKVDYRKMSDLDIINS
jgi:hypothetical protein